RPRRIRPRDLQDWIGPEDVPIDRVLIGEHSLRECLADDGYGLFAFHIELIEIAAGKDGNAERCKESGRDHTILCAGILYARGMTIGTELQGRTGADVAPGSNHPVSGPIDTWKRINATYDFLVKIDNLLPCLSVKYRGNVDSKDMARVHTGLRPLQCKERTDDHTRPGQQHERCAYLRYNKHTLTTLAAGCPNATAYEVQCTGRVGGKPRDKGQNRCC